MNLVNNEQIRPKVLFNSGKHIHFQMRVKSLKSVPEDGWRCARAAHQVTQFLFATESERDRSVWRLGGRYVGTPRVLSALKPRGVTRGWRVCLCGMCVCVCGGGDQEALNTFPGQL